MLSVRDGTFGDTGGGSHQGSEWVTHSDPTIVQVEHWYICYLGAMFT